MRENDILKGEQGALKRALYKSMGFTQLSAWRMASVSEVMRLMMSPVRVWLK